MFLFNRPSEIYLKSDLCLIFWMAYLNRKQLNIIVRKKKQIDCSCFTMIFIYLKFQVRKWWHRNFVHKFLRKPVQFSKISYCKNEHLPSFKNAKWCLKAFFMDGDDWIDFKKVVNFFGLANFIIQLVALASLNGLDAVFAACRSVADLLVGISALECQFKSIKTCNLFLPTLSKSHAKFWYRLGHWVSSWF